MFELRPDRANGVFETLLIIDGSPIELEAHLERLSRSVRELFGGEPPAGTRQLVLDGASPVAVGRLRLTLAPGPAGVLTADTLTASVDPEDVFPSWERAIILHPLVVPGGLGAHKWADRAGLAAAESSASKGCLPLLLDVDGEVLEASRANVFAVEGEVLITPAADGRILPGVARARAIEAARSLGIDLREEALTIEELIGAGEAFVTGSVRGVEPVRSIGEAELAAPGETVSEIAAEMRASWIGTGATRWVRAR